MTKKRVLLQCQSLTYLYMGLASIYTKHPKKDVIVDVLFVVNDKTKEIFGDKIFVSKYPNKVFIFQLNETLKQINWELSYLEDTLANKILFNIDYKNQIKNYVKELLDGNKYSEVFFSHELRSNIITFLKIAFPKACFVMYGDGSGLLMGKNAKLVDPYIEQLYNPFYTEIKPNKIISIAPFTEDKSVDTKNVPVMATNPKILADIIQNDENVQKDINVYTNELLEKYSKYDNKVVLLITRLEDKRFMMSEDDQINIYVDMIDKYCSDNSLVILKLHPTGSTAILDLLRKRCRKNVEFVSIPPSLKMMPVEVFPKLMCNVSDVISFLSSSKISLKLLYDIDCIDAYDVAQNYGVKDRINFMFNVFTLVLNKYQVWNKKSLLYEFDVVPYIEKFCQINNVLPKEKAPVRPYEQEKIDKFKEEKTLKNYLCDVIRQYLFSERFEFLKSKKLFARFLRNFIRIEEIKYENKIYAQLTILGIKSKF